MTGVRVSFKEQVHVHNIVSVQMLNFRLISSACVVIMMTQMGLTLTIRGRFVYLVHSFDYRDDDDDVDDAKDDDGDYPGG
jgi:hypothetical protein